MPERRFNESEVAAIIERATTMEGRAHQMVPTSEGMTLAELQEIGREVGIEPRLIADAAASLDVRKPAVTRTVLGLPMGVERVIELERPLSNEEWERLVGDLREIFDARGSLRTDGSLREWTNGNLQALLERTATAQRLRLKTYKGNAMAAIATGTAMLGAGGAGLIAMNVPFANSGIVAMLTMTVAAGAAMLGNTVLRLPGWARRRREQMEEVAARVARIRANATDADGT